MYDFRYVDTCIRTWKLRQEMPGAEKCTKYIKQDFGDIALKPEDAKKPAGAAGSDLRRPDAAERVGSDAANANGMVSPAESAAHSSVSEEAWRKKQRVVSDGARRRILKSLGESSLYAKFWADRLGMDDGMPVEFDGVVAVDGTLTAKANLYANLNLAT
jgi:hypothetical protein